jgi:hypothetical protein
MTEKEAITLLRAAGYSVSKSRPKKQRRVGPTCVVRFADGEVTRMTTYCPGDVLDYARGEWIARHAWSSRKRRPVRQSPRIASIHFERDGEMISEQLVA